MSNDLGKQSLEKFEMERILSEENSASFWKEYQGKAGKHVITA